MTKIEAKKAGIKAYHSGIKEASPCLDKPFMEKLTRLNKTNELLNWIEGYNEAKGE